MAVLSEMKNADLTDIDGVSRVAAWSTMIDHVDALTAKVGGVANLKKCLTTASSLMDLTKE